MIIYGFAATQDVLLGREEDADDVALLPGGAKRPGSPAASRVMTNQPGLRVWYAMAACGMHMCSRELHPDLNAALLRDMLAILPLTFFTELFFFILVILQNPLKWQCDPILG